MLDTYAISAIKGNNVIAITADGNYYVGDIDLKNGGECKKVDQKYLLDEDFLF